MALGFDMADRIVDPSLSEAQISSRIKNWNDFFTTWDKKPVFAGRYFGDTNHRWVNGEIPSNLRTVVPNFSELEYILPFTATGRISFPDNGEAWVNDDGIVNGPVTPQHPKRHMQIYQQGFGTNGKPLPLFSIAENAKNEATATCKQIAELIQANRPINPINNPDTRELKVSNSGQVFVFLDVEPQTILHGTFWINWADTVLTYTVDLGEGNTPELHQPFLPCIYFWCHQHGPALEENRNLFASLGLPRCHALVATAQHPNYDETETNLENLMSGYFGTGMYQAACPSIPAPVLVWQYHINHVFLGNFEIDFDFLPDGVDPDIPYRGRPITDYMLKINW